MSAPRTCREADRLSAHLRGTLDEDEESRLVAHLDTCVLCQQTLEQLAAGDADLLDTARAVGHEPPPDDPRLSQLLDRLGQSSPIDSPPHHSPARGAVVGATAKDSIDFLDLPRNPANLGRLGEYEVVELIARGGMGIVLKGIDEKLGRAVCLKVLAPQIAASDTARRRFVREAQAAAAIRSPQVVAIYAVSEAHGLPFLVMEYIEGQSLEQRLNASGPLAVEDIAQIGGDMATGLAAAHARGLVHRDVKPGNILLDQASGLARLTDFGLARAIDDASITREGVVGGTPEYMSPEQARGEPLDHRSDLFSLGSVLYAMCTGQSPFQADNSLAVVNRICEASPRPIAELNPGIPRWLSEIVEKLHARFPAERFQSSADVVSALRERTSPASPVIRQPTTPPEPRARRQRTWQPVLAAVALVCVGLLVAAQIVIRVRNKDGQTTEVAVPDGASVEVTKDGKVSPPSPRGTSIPQAAYGVTRGIRAM